MEIFVYALCALTSILCAGLLLKGFAESRTPLLLWAGLCFVGLAVNNVILFVDIRVIPDVDLSVWRTMPALVGVLLLIYGLVWETR
ncbi:MAG: DUF5985 family protein [Gemmatimonadota bacterium]|nr:DUF5985 family protein [Gemmatimonadota bacterium]